ncbi:hypothetical protein BH10BAC2_BH10BAC2_18010 [soil metagenome]
MNHSSNTLHKPVHIHASKDGIPTRCLHAIQHYLLMQGIRAVTTRTSVHLHNPNTLFQYYKNFNIKKRLSGKALCLLQTQYAKKPKNPV